MPSIGSAQRLAAFVTAVNVRMYSSVRRLAGLLHISKSRAHALLDETKPESITLADLLALGMAGADEPRAIAIGILGTVVEYVGANSEVLRAAKRARQPVDEQLSLFGDDHDAKRSRP